MGLPHCHAMRTIHGPSVHTHEYQGNPRVPIPCYPVGVDKPLHSEDKRQQVLSRQQMRGFLQ